MSVFDGSVLWGGGGSSPHDLSLLVKDAVRDSKVLPCVKTAVLPEHAPSNHQNQYKPSADSRRKSINDFVADLPFEKTEIIFF